MKCKYTGREIVSPLDMKHNEKETTMDIGPVGTKYEVIKGGMVDPFRDKSGVRMKPGEIWDLVPSTLGGPCLRKLNKNGSSTRLLNGVCFAACMMDEGRARILAADDPKALAHDEMERSLKAKWDAEKKASAANAKDDRP